MRVSTSQFQQASTNTILDQQSQLLKTQNQLGTGRRILTPSDDPSGAARALDMDKAVKSTEQLQRNNEQAELRLRQEDSTLDQVSNVVNRIRELTVQGSNGTQSQSDRRAIASELRERRDELVDLANTQDGNGEFLFSGLKTKTEPFVSEGGQVQYQGDQGQRSIQVGPNRQVDSSHNGFETFMKIPAGNGDFGVFTDDGNTGSGRLAGAAVTDADAPFRGPYEIRFAENPATGELEQRVVAGDFVDEDGEVPETGFVTDGLDAGVDADEGPWTGEVSIEVGEESSVLDLDDVTGGVSSVEDLAEAVSEFVNGLTGDAAPAGDLVIDDEGGELDFGYDGDDPVRVGINLEDDQGGTFTQAGSLGSLIEAGPYQANEGFSFDGRTVTIDGNPEPGDSFEVREVGSQSIFDTVDDVIQAFEERPDSNAGRARLATESFQALENLDQAINSFSDIRAQTGARLNALESEFEANEVAKLDLQTELSRVEDLDVAEAVSRLNQQSVGLEAAQRSYAQVQQLSLFDFI
ncbi:flagellar hook-associated protein FlgL [Aquisalimonas sp. 2447]|uniref:flagellar hook-associated protein FlgL n=1 Tax=Aquisalimonas sp. 2447 TaxID=2740807 RepID=UPI0014324108|nr:flagellar hook-associated protein FlgL [Aquisalimonas sp. 2447]QIT56166.1 flagellar hook-associated protein FlgL [Aquisalimonas sp. 2447]